MKVIDTDLYAALSEKYSVPREQVKGVCFGVAYNKLPEGKTFAEACDDAVKAFAERLQACNTQQ